MRRTMNQLLKDSQDIVSDNSTVESDRLSSSTDFLYRMLCEGISVTKRALRNAQESLREVSTILDTNGKIGYPHSGREVQDIYALNTNDPMGSHLEPMERINNVTKWNRVTAGAERAVYPKYYFLAPEGIRFYPKPLQPLRVVVELQEQDRVPTMTQLDGSIGLLQITNNTNVVNIIPKDSEFSLPVMDGWWLFLGGRWYQIDKTMTTRRFELTTIYDGNTIQGTDDFVIGDCPDLPDDLIHCLPNYAASKYFLSKQQNLPMSQTFLNLFWNGSPPDPNQAGNQRTNDGVTAYINHYMVSGRDNTPEAILNRMERYDVGF